MGDTADPPSPDAGPRPELIDLRGLRCPLPALKTRKALSRAAPGTRLRVECTDPLAAIDIPHLLQLTRDVLEAQHEEGGLLVFQIRKAG